MKRYRNVFQAIALDGHDEYYSPQVTRAFLPSDAAPGSREKIDLLRERVSRGLPLWHHEDRNDYGGLTAVVPPRYV